MKKIKKVLTNHLWIIITFVSITIGSIALLCVPRNNNGHAIFLPKTLPITKEKEIKIIFDKVKIKNNQYEWYVSDNDTDWHNNAEYFTYTSIVIEWHSILIHDLSWVRQLDDFYIKVNINNNLDFTSGKLKF